MKKIKITSSDLHLLGMLFMLIDHVWGILMTGNIWMNCVGRIAFPIFAFSLVEGYFHTRNVGSYMKRLLLLAVLSEIPFNLMIYSGVLFPFHQNVVWTFLIALAGIWAMETQRKKRSGIAVTLLCAAISAGCILLGTVGMTDYGGAGVAMAFVFYFFRGNTFPQRLAQFAAMAWINLFLIGGMEIPVPGLGLYFPVQGFALLAFLPIWLYNGEKGWGGKGFSWFYYAFYPVHMLVLAFISRM